MKIIPLLREARQEAGITQADLALLAGCHQVSICLIETGVRIPSIERLVSIGDALGVEWYDLVEVRR